MKEYSFEKLIVWQKAKVLTVLIAKLTRKFPREELFGLTSQIRRSSNSINSNIAEGSGKHSGKEKARFTEYSYSSALETLNHAMVCYELDYLSQEEYFQIRSSIDEITAMLDSLYKSQIKI